MQFTTKKIPYKVLFGVPLQYPQHQFQTVIPKDNNFAFQVRELSRNALHRRAKEINTNHAGKKFRLAIFEIGT